jgi:subtilisin family serine protease
MVYALDTELDNSWGVDRIDAEEVWTTYTGQGVNVAIIDSGIDNNHSDLNVEYGVNFVSKPSWKDPDPDKWDDDYGHGTHVAGIVAALGNGVGVVGVAPGAALYALKVLDRTGSGYVSDVVAAIMWATDPNGDGSADDRLDVINMSLGSTYDSWLLDGACLLAYAEGLILVAAAGNGGSVIYPAAYPWVIAVSATDINDELAWFSSTGSEVELAAPGVEIYSTYKDGGYTTYSGTSMAAPHVAGTAALVIAAGIPDVRGQLKSTAENINLLDTEQGYGLVDAEKAVLPTQQDTGTITGTVTNTSTGEAIEGVKVTADLLYSDFTTNSGTYILDDIPVGTYTVTASADGYNSAFQGITVKADITYTVDFALEEITEELQKLHVNSIDMWYKSAGPNRFVSTKVEIVSSDGTAVSGATVYLETTLPDDSKVSGSGDTTGDGTITFETRSRQTGTYTSTVTHVKKDGWEYNSIENVETSDSITVP